MLVLSRRIGERLVIDDKITVTPSPTWKPGRR